MAYFRLLTADDFLRFTTELYNLNSNTVALMDIIQIMTDQEGDR